MRSKVASARVGGTRNGRDERIPGGQKIKTADERLSQFSKKRMGTTLRGDLKNLFFLNWISH